MFFARAVLALVLASAAAALHINVARAPQQSPPPVVSGSTSTTSVPPTSSTPRPPRPRRGTQIHPNGNGAKCLDVQGNIRANGTPVQIYDCNGTGAQQWIFNRANTKVRLAGTNFCLDAGSAPASGVGMKIWTCYDNLPAQAWYYTDDNRIAVTGKGQCLDLTNGVLSNANRVQTWKCTDGNTNQIWTA